MQAICSWAERVMCVHILVVVSAFTHGLWIWAHALIVNSGLKCFFFVATEYSPILWIPVLSNCKILTQKRIENWDTKWKKKPYKLYWSLGSIHISQSNQYNDHNGWKIKCLLQKHEKMKLDVTLQNSKVTNDNLKVLKSLDFILFHVSLQNINPPSKPIGEMLPRANKLQTRIQDSWFLPDWVARWNISWFSLNIWSDVTNRFTSWFYWPFRRKHKPLSLRSTERQSDNRQIIF
jgi:hypothetical protein